jgi:hypothetical protein
MVLQGSIFKGADGSDDSARFEEAFPEIKSVKVTIEESGPGNEGLGLRELTRRSVREYINCSNPDCLGKGLLLGDVLRRMQTEKQTQLSWEQNCSSKDHAGRPCANHFRIRIYLLFF